MLDQPQVDGSQNGTVPAIDSSADGNVATAEIRGDDAFELSAESEKSETEKKKD